LGFCRGGFGRRMRVEFVGVDWRIGVVGRMVDHVK